MKKNQVEIVELKQYNNWKIKSWMDGFYHREDTGKERLSELIVNQQKNIQTETEEKRLENTELSLRDMWDNVKWLNTYTIRVPEREEREWGKR